MCVFVCVRVCHGHARFTSLTRHRSRVLLLFTLLETQNKF